MLGVSTLVDRGGSARGADSPLLVVDVDLLAVEEDGETVLDSAVVSVDEVQRRAVDERVGRAGSLLLPMASLAAAVRPESLSLVVAHVVL